MGCLARGDAREDSDVDFLVIESEPHDKFNEMVRLRQAEIAMHQNSCASAVYWALREGKVLYAAPH